jgi:hypothetical protein
VWQCVEAEAKLEADARRDVPVVHCIKGWRLVDVVANGSGLELRVAVSQAEQNIHKAVVRSVARGVCALLGADDLLVLGVTVVADHSR